MPMLAAQTVGSPGRADALKRVAQDVRRRRHGLFPAVNLMHDHLVDRYRVVLIGACDGVFGHFHRIGIEQKISYPLVEQLLAGVSCG